MLPFVGIDVRQMGTSQSRVIPFDPNKKAVVDAPNAEMIDIPGGIGSCPRFQVGVTEYFFPWLTSVIENGYGEKLPDDISTEQLVWGAECSGPTGPSPIKWSITTQTKESKSSFIVWCVANGYTKDDHGRPLFGAVTTFVSHAWKGSFLSLKHSILERCRKEFELNPKNKTPPAFFLDIFVVNQHLPPWKEEPSIGMDFALKQPIQLSLKTMLVMSPYTDPVPLKRAWCIYEICNTKRLGASLDITMPDHEHERFIDALTRGEFDFNDWVANIDIEQAAAFDPNDKRMIMELVEQTPGSAPGLNRTVILALCEWLSSQGKIALAKIPEDQRGHSALLKNLANIIWRQGKPQEAEPLYRDMVHCRRKEYGDKDFRTLEALHVWGRFLRAKGEWDESFKVLEETVAGRKEILGADHEDTLTSTMELAEVMRGMDKTKEADVLIKQVVDKWKSVFKILESNHNKSDKEVHFIHVNYLESLKVQAAVMLQLGKGNRDDEKIKTVLQELHEGRVKLFGPRNPATLDVVVLQSQHFVSMKSRLSPENTKALEGSLSILRGTLGDTHPRTLSCMCILSQVIALQYEEDEAEKLRILSGGADACMLLLDEAVKGYTSTLGEDHPDTKSAIRLQQKHKSDVEAYKSNSNVETTNDEDDDKYNTCFSPDSLVLMADGVETKRAEDIAIGDKVYAPHLEGGAAAVLGHIIQKQDGHARNLIKIGDMLISKMHRVQYKGEWIRPRMYPNAQEVKLPCELHNFIVTASSPIVVNGIVVSTIGTFCEGLHDMKKPNHALWASSQIVDVFKLHPRWPVIVLDNESSNFLKVLKNPLFAADVVAMKSIHSEAIGQLIENYGGIALDVQ